MIVNFLHSQRASSPVDAAKPALLSPPGNAGTLSVIWLFRAGLPTDQIAERLRLQESTVYNLMHRERCRVEGLPCEVQRNRSPSPRTTFSAARQVIR